MECQVEAAGKIEYQFIREKRDRAKSAVNVISGINVADLTGHGGRELTNKDRDSRADRR